jgi:hypothetical protein
VPGDLDLNIRLIDGSAPAGAGRGSASPAGAGAGSPAGGWGAPQGLVSALAPHLAALITIRDTLKTLAGLGSSPVGGFGEASGVAGGGGAPGPTRLARGLQAATNILGQFTHALELGVGYVRAQSQATAVAIAQNDIIGERIRQRQATANLVGGGVAAGGTLAAIGLGVTGVVTGGASLVIAGIAAGIGYGISALGGSAASTTDQTLVDQSGAFDKRLQNLGRFGGPIAGALARRNLARLQRDRAEAGALGPLGAELLDLETQRDSLSQQIGSLQALKGGAAQRKRLEDEIANLRKQVKDMAAELGEAGRRIVAALERGAKSPAEKVLEGIKAPGDPRAERDRLLDQLRAQQANAPVFAGR